MNCRARKWWGLAAVLIVALAGCVPLLLAALDAGWFRPALIHYLAAHFDRPIRIEGPLQLQLLSRHPRLAAHQVIIGNPAWSPPGEMARIGQLVLVYSAPFGWGATLESVTLENAALHLVRDAQGRANWRRTDSLIAQGKPLPLIQELSAAEAHVVLDDARRHLKFDGKVSAQGRRQAAPQRLRIEGKGQLNGRPTSFVLSADSLESARPEVPYAWEFSEESSGSHLVVRGSLPLPFDFNLVDADFDAAGEDLKDLYYLTGVTLFDTGAYRLTGTLQRRAANTRFQLRLRNGESDLDGSLSIETLQGRPHLDANLSAALLRTSDFGVSAAGRGAPADIAVATTPARIFSDAAFNPASLRRTDTLLRFTAQRLEAGRMTLESIEGQMQIDHGVVNVLPLTANLLQGRLEAQIRVDAKQDTPAVEASLRLAGLRLSALDRGSEPPLEGVMQVRVDVTGQGRSLHQVAASANGRVSAALPGGMIRASLAELAGVDLRGVGLTLTHSKREVEVRCAAAVFQARDGVLKARSLVIDTVPVLITGEGDVHLDTEEVNLTLRGQPKDMRLLRLEAPLVVRGTLSRPSLSVETHAASVKLLDRGHAQDVDCASLLAQARPKAAPYSTAWPETGPPDAPAR